MNDTSAQLFEFLVALYAGIVAGIYYDVCRILRRLINKVWASALLDTLFWVGCALIAFGAFYIANGARPRWYLLLGMAIGVLLHFCSTSIIMNLAFERMTAHVRRKLLLKRREADGKERE